MLAGHASSSWLSGNVCWRAVQQRKKTESLVCILPPGRVPPFNEPQFIQALIKLIYRSNNEENCLKVKYVLLFQVLSKMWRITNNKNNYFPRKGVGGVNGKFQLNNLLTPSLKQSVPTSFVVTVPASFVGTADSLKCPQMLAGHASGSWLAVLGAVQQKEKTKAQFAPQARTFEKSTSWG